MLPLTPTRVLVLAAALADCKAPPPMVGDVLEYEVHLSQRRRR